MNEEKRLDGLSFDNVHARIEELKRMFPEAVKEGRLDYDTFMALLGDEFDNDREKYDFTWKGKLDSLKLAQRRSNGTLRPDMEQSRDWDTTGNLYLEGDNLEVMKLLQQGYLRSVKMIYIDPPYNTGNDFVYEDDFADPIAKYKEATGQGMRANPETAGRYHSRWLSMMYPRLKIAKTLLRDDGVIFISIDDNEIHNCRKLCDDVFGEENFISQITVVSNPRGRQSETFTASVHEYLLVYARRIEFCQLNGAELSEDQILEFKHEDDDGRKYRFLGLRQRGVAWRREDRPAMFFPIYADPSNGSCSISKTNAHTIEILPIKPDGQEGRWKWGKDRVAKDIVLLEARVVEGRGEWDISVKDYLDRADGNQRTRKFKTVWDEKELNYQNGTTEVKLLFDGSTIFDFPKPVSLLSRIIEAATEFDSIILDFFSGSGTCAHAVLNANMEDSGSRKFICIQVPEPTDPTSSAGKAGYKSIAEIGKERIRRAGDKILTEWQEKHADRLPLGEAAPTPPDIGFRVFRLDSSNWKPWDDSFVSPDEPDLFVERLKAHLDNAKPDRRDIDVIYEVFLKYGVALTEKLSTLEIEGKRFYVVGESGYMFICLDKNMTVEVVEAAAKYNPGTMIFADECFADNTELTNAALVLEKVGIEFRWI